MSTPTLRVVASEFALHDKPERSRDVGRPTNRLVAEWTDDGMEVRFVDGADAP